MNILLCTRVFSCSGTDPWLLDDLAAAFDEHGHTVTVLYLDISGKQPKGMVKTKHGFDVFCYPITKKNMGSTLATGIRYTCQLTIASIYFLLCIRKKQIDIAINITMFSFFAIFLDLLFLTRRKIRLIGIVWDFYPVHWVEIGKLKNKYVAKLLYWVESRQFTRTDTLCFMSPASKEFCDNYHPSTKRSKYIFTKLWRTLGDERPTNISAKSVSNQPLNIIFGGQISRGRGFDQILESAHQLSGIADFTIIGDGELWKELDNTISARKLKNVALKKRLTRDAYLKLVEAADVGIVATVADVTIPSFPSKCLDYMIMKKAIIAAVESTSDFGQFVSEDAKCGITADVGSVESLVGVIKYLSQNRDVLARFGESGYQYFLENMQTKIVASDMIRMREA